MVTLESAKRSVGAGWHPLIEPLYATLPEGVAVSQVKEKFGGLRFYWHRLVNEVDEFFGDEAAIEHWRTLVDAAEAASYRTCEACGKPGVARNRGGWVVTACAECDAARGNS